MEKLLAMFFEGLLSFFTPCVFPLIPLYMAYLSSGTISSKGEIKEYNKKKTFILTLCFIIGISFSFIMLSLSISALNRYISNYRNIIGTVGGVLLIILGLNQLGVLKINILNRELRFDYRFNNNKVNYLEAFMLGFVFSFAWTPCIGPMLSNAIVLSIQDSVGSLYIITYGLGLVIPFFITGIFTTSVLKFINSNKKIVKTANIIAGTLVVFSGVYLLYSVVSSPNNVQNNTKDVSNPIVDVEYELLNGQTVSLNSDNNIALHYIASWCHYCIEDLSYFEDFCNNHDDLTCYLVMNDNYNRAQGGTSSAEFYNTYRPSIDIINDKDAILYNYLNIEGVPYTYFINKEGVIYNIIPGAVYSEYETYYNN